MASIDNLSVTTSAGRPNTLLVDGQIDSHTSSLLNDALSARDAGDEIAVDLSQVAFIDSSGLRVLVQAHKRQVGGGGRLTIVEPSDAVCRLFEITGLVSELTIT